MRRAAVLAFDGDVNIDFDDEPPRDRGPQLFGRAPRALPPRELQVRREGEGEALRSRLEGLLQDRLGWATTRLDGKGNPTWAELMRRHTPFKYSDWPRMVRVSSLPAYAEVAEIHPAGSGRCSEARREATTGSGFAPDPGIAAPLGTLAHELGADAFVLVHFYISRVRTAGDVGPLLVNQPMEVDGQNSLTPVAHVHVVVVDRCGRAVAIVDEQAVAERCRLRLSSESSDDERCALEDAVSAALERAVVDIGSSTSAH